MEAAPAITEPTGLWAAVREALAGTHRDYTEGRIGHAILMLAVPMVLELVLESVFAVVDVFFVSRLGADAVATVGLTESMLVIIYAIAVGLSMGAMAIVARRIGERDRDGAARAAVQAVLLALGVALPPSGWAAPSSHARCSRSWERRRAYWPTAATRRSCLAQTASS